MITRRRLFALAAAVPAVPIAAMLPKVETLYVGMDFGSSPAVVAYRRAMATALGKVPADVTWFRSMHKLGSPLSKARGFRIDVDFKRDEIADDYPPMA